MKPLCGIAGCTRHQVTDEEFDSIRQTERQQMDNGMPVFNTALIDHTIEEQIADMQPDARKRILAAAKENSARRKGQTKRNITRFVEMQRNHSHQ